MLILIAMTLLNRVRGLTFEWLPGRNIYFVAPMVGVLRYGQTLEILTSVAFGVGYLLWGSAPWGRWYDLGRLPVEHGREHIAPNAYEKIVQAISFGSDHLALLVRHFSGLLPLFLFLGLRAHALELWVAYTLLAAILIVTAYELAWRIRPSKPIIIAELQVGFLWGFLILIAN